MVPILKARLNTPFPCSKMRLLTFVTSTKLISPTIMHFWCASFQIHVATDTSLRLRIATENEHHASIWETQESGPKKWMILVGFAQSGFLHPWIDMAASFPPFARYLWSRSGLPFKAMAALSINTNLSVFLDTAFGFAFFAAHIVVDLFETGKIGAAQRLGQPTQGLLSQSSVMPMPACQRRTLWCLAKLNTLAGP